MGQSLKKRAQKHGLWPESRKCRGKDFQASRAQLRRLARKRVDKPRKGLPWERRFKKKERVTEGGETIVTWQRGGE